VLISNGVGITPMLAMAKASISAANNRPIWFLHGCRNGKYQAFHDEVRQLSSEHPELKVHVAYSRSDPCDSGRYESEGYIDVALIRSLVKTDADYYLCGSPPFMEAIVNGLQEAGVEASAITFEMFSKARSATTPAQATGPAQTATVRFDRSQQEAEWQGSEASLLAFAEDQGLNQTSPVGRGCAAPALVTCFKERLPTMNNPMPGLLMGKCLFALAGQNQLL
jgi:ferredoxin-NADP reductase